ncbi:hypothetical protein Tco_0473993 [Tanacetum coccineum]
MNANPIRYAITINPTIYTSCIEQFWATVKAKTINGEIQLQALVDRKKIIITESIVRRDLQLEDAEDIDCLPNATIFEQLTLMGNEFSSTMASAIICLATNQKFNFSKYIFESMVKNLENVSGKFLMYPRFVQVFLEKQLEGMSNHKRIYVTPSHTKNIFRNMRRVGRGFSGRETPLFQTMVVQHQEEMGKGSANPSDPYHTPTIIQPSTSQPQKKQKPRRPKRKDTEIPQSSSPTDSVAEKAVNEKMDDNPIQRQPPNEPSSLGTSSGGGPRRQETIGDTIAQTRSENVSKHYNDPLLARGNTLQSSEDKLKLKELMEFCTKLQQRVLDLENTKTAQSLENTSLKLRSPRKVASKHGRKIDDIDKDAEITLIDETQGRYGDDLMFDTGESRVNLQQEQDLNNYHQDKGKGIIEEPEKPTKRKDQIRHDEEVSQRLQAQMQAELEEEDRLVRQREEEANIVSWDNVQAMIDTDYQMAQQRQAEEQEKLSIEEKSKLFVQLLEARKKQFAAIRANEKRNKPPTKAQKINTMSTYLKNMTGYKHNHLKNKSFDDIQKLFDKAMKRVNTFVDMDT